jgi:hypothetical protein
MTVQYRIVGAIVGRGRVIGFAMFLSLISDLHSHPLFQSRAALALSLSAKNIKKQFYADLF